MAWTPASSRARRFHSPESSPNHSNIHSWVPSGLVAKPSRDRTILRITFRSLMQVETYPIPRFDRSSAGFAPSSTASNIPPPRRSRAGRFSTVIPDATAEDWPAIWPIYAQIVRAADTFSYDPAIGEDAAREMWMVPPPGRTTVAVANDGTIGGTRNMLANPPEPGDHIASGNYMVATGRRGQGIGRALLEDSLRWARKAGFRAMQFNAVAECNTPAVELYRRGGFFPFGRGAGGVRPPERGEVALLVMHRRL